MPPTALRFAGSRRAIHGEAGAGQAEHHHREEPGHERAGAGIAGEEALEIAGDAVVVAEQEPGDVVDDVVQAGDDQHAVQHAVDEQADGFRSRAPPGWWRPCRCSSHWPAEAEDQRQDQPGEAADDGHEAPAAEEGQVARQADVAEAVVGPAGDEPGQQAHAAR